MEKVIEKLQATFDITDVKKQKEGLYLLSTPKDKAEALITNLRDHEGFVHLSFLTAIDYIEDNIFRLTYMLHNYDTATDVAVHVDLDRENPVMHSMHHLWHQVETYQRELKEMFGIEFPGSPRLNDNFMLEGWEEIPPMRRDFDTTAYSKKTFFPREGRETFDPREYMKSQLYPNREG